MLFLILSIISNISLLVVIKALDRFRMNTLVAIVVNYLFAGTASFFLLEKQPDLNDIHASGILPFAITTGILFIFNLFFMTQSAQKINISVATVANKMSLVITISLAFFLYGDQLEVFKIIGIVLALLSIVLTCYIPSKSGVSMDKMLYIFPLLVFVISGTIDSILSYTAIKLVRNADDNVIYSCLSFISAGAAGLIWASASVAMKKTKVDLRSIIGGIVLGIPNFCTIFFIVKTIDSGFMESTRLFPLLNITILASVSVIGVWMFKEKLHKINYIGLAVSILSIFLVTFRTFFK